MKHWILEYYFKCFWNAGGYTETLVRNAGGYTETLVRNAGGYTEALCEKKVCKPWNL